MKAAFESYLSSLVDISANPRFLLAVSGGIDSVCLSHLFSGCQLNFGIAHCNFSLRGAASDEDALFVKTLAESLKVPYYEIAFDTLSYAEKEGLSIQEAARELRYSWLEEIRQTHRYQYLVTGHQLNDSIETVLFHFARGSGLRGLHGIPPVNGQIIRPLLFAGREQIEHFCREEGFLYREDKSNLSDKYTRNLIRHQVIPVFQKINPAFEKNASETIQHIREAEWLFDFAIEKLKTQYFRETPEGAIIQLEGLSELPAAPTLLYEWLQPYGFHGDQIRQILASHEESGKLFYASNYQLLLDRRQLLLRKITEKEDLFLEIEFQHGEMHWQGMQIECRLESAVEIPVSNPPEVAFFDLEKLHFPLILRKWKAGDRFAPLGMGGKRQKLQDFFTQRKLSLFEKENVWVLESAGEICWVLGYRLDERFKIGDGTKEVFRVRVRRGG